MIIFPPRPRDGQRIQPGQLPYLESLGTYLCQRKYNGDRAIFKRHASGRNEIYYGKTGRPFKNWRAPASLLHELGAIKLPAKKESFLDSELIPASNIIIIFDALQVGEYLTGVSQIQRLEILAEACGNPASLDANPVLALRVTEHVWLAQYWAEDFVRHYRECLGSDLIEGLMLRLRDSVLSTFGMTPYEVTWQIRVRKPSKKYRY